MGQQDITSVNVNRRRLFKRAAKVGMAGIAASIAFGSQLEFAYAGSPNSSADDLGALYRLYHPVVDHHFYTMDQHEADDFIRNDGYTSEGVAAYIYTGQDISSYPDLRAFYRLYHPSTGAYFYTADPLEADNAVNFRGYTGQGITGFVYTLGTGHPDVVPFYDLYKGETDDHLYTTSRDEADYVVYHSGYIWSGIACYVLPS